MNCVLHTIGSLGSEKGGPSRTVPRLCAELRDDKRWSPQLICTDPPGTQLPISQALGLTAQCTGGGARFWRSVGERLAGAPMAPAIVHDHGLWLASNAMACMQALRRHALLVISPRGMLQAEAISHRAWKKHLAMAGYQAALLRRANAFHATSSAEIESLRRLGLRQPVLLLPNGVDLPASGQHKPMTEGPKHALFLSRIHPHKGVVELLQAWAALRPPGWRLTLAGPGEPAFRARVAQLVATMPAGTEVSMHDAVADGDKWALYAGTDLVVLPSRSENFGVVVAEALASSVPVITTTGTPWSQIRERDCGWYVAPDVASLTDALREATGLDRRTLSAMGARGHRWMQTDFVWQGVGRRLADAYDWLAAGQPPDAVPSGFVLG